MKRFSLFAIVIAMGLAGCSAADWDNAMSFLPVEKPSQATMPAETSSPADPAPTAAAYSSAPPSAPVAAPTQVSGREIAVQHCQAIAAQRSSDGAYMGMDEDAQEQEYKLTYANCMAWETAHGG
jgi:hypothetical protein